MRNKPDDRTNNVDRIQNHINNNIKNIRLAEEMIEKTDDENAKKSLIEKNKRRKDSLSAMKSEIKDEALDKQNGYK